MRAKQSAVKESTDNLPKTLLRRLVEVAELAAAGVPLTTQQASLYLQISQTTLEIWRCHGTGPKSIGGATPRYLKSDLDTFLVNRKDDKKRVSPNVGRPPRKKARVQR